MKIIKQIFKIFLLIFFNLSLLLGFVVISDYFAYRIYAKVYKKNHIKVEDFHYELLTKKTTLKKEKEVIENKLRKPDGLQFKSKHSITIFGCSFAYGTGLKQNQTLGYKLSGLLKTPVYNRALSWGNIQEMWYQAGAEGAKELNNTVPTDTYIYVMINDHYSRMYSFATVHTWRQYLNYIDNKGNLRNELQLSLLQSILRLSYTYRHFENIKANKYLKNPKNKNEIINRAAAYFIETKNNLKADNNKEISFIVLFYDNINYEKELKEKLEKNGIIVISTKDLTNENLRNIKYTLSKKDLHPNENAWDLITPLLAEKIQKIWQNKDNKTK